MSTNLLARCADAAFWLGRYMERAESLARIVDVHDSFNRSTRGIADWRDLLRLYGDEARFAESHGEPTAQAVTCFYLLDKNNPGSVASSVIAARQNARVLRPMISSEIWEQLNVFYHWLDKVDADSLRSPGLYRVCNQIKERCQMHAGVGEATMYRDEVWYFWQIGRWLERGQQTSHYLDVRCNDLTPTSDDDSNEFDLIQWTALLRSQAGLHGYRRLYRGMVKPRRVISFLLFDDGFPRAVMTCINRVVTYLSRMRADFNLRSGEAALANAKALQERFDRQTIDDVVKNELDEYLDRVQRAFNALSVDLQEEFFDAPKPLGESAQLQ